MEGVLLLAHLSLVLAEKRSFGLPQVGRLTTVAVGTTDRLRVVGIPINRVWILVRFVGVGDYSPPPKSSPIDSPKCLAAAKPPTTLAALTVEALLERVCKILFCSVAAILVFLSCNKL